MKLAKRETLIQNIAYMALMAAINVIFVLLTTLVPVLMFLIIIVLPLTSTMVTLLCKKKYFPIYAIATIALCMIVTIWKIDDTIFYVIPSIITETLSIIVLALTLSYSNDDNNLNFFSSFLVKNLNLILSFDCGNS